jgi:hypothetical protein
MNKNLAYLIGVFLGDGYIAHDRSFGLQTIDKDFVDFTAKALSTNTTKKITVGEINRLTTAKNIVYYLYNSDLELNKLLLSITDGKIHLPIDFSEWEDDLQKELIAGLLDSEGYVSMYNIHYYNNQKCFSMSIGIGATDVWIYELHSFFQKKGGLVGQITREKIKSGKIFAKFSFNKKSFIKNGLYFKIFRKQKRIEEYKTLFPGSTTKRDIPKTLYTKQQISEGLKDRVFSDLTKQKMSDSAKKKNMVRNDKGQYVRCIGNDIV